MTLTSKVALLIFEGALHEQEQDFVQEGTSTEFTGLVGNLSQASFPNGRRTVLDFQQDLRYVISSIGSSLLILLLENLDEILYVLRLEKRKTAHPGNLGSQLGSETSCNSNLSCVGVLWDLGFGSPR